VGVPYGDGVLEGYIDLLYRDDNGLVIVDYKTDAWHTDADLDAKVERYAVQLAAYAGAVEVAADEPVQSKILLFVSEAGSVIRAVP
jgi:ATP-dependent exoDNAse (exonuclease V) beta subunit